MCRSSSGLCCPHDLPGLFCCSTWNHWGRVSQELWQLGHASMRMYTHTHTRTHERVDTWRLLSPLWLSADKHRLHVGVCVSRRPGVRRGRRLHQRDQMSVCAQRSAVPAWGLPDRGLQHLVCPVTHTHTHTLAWMKKREGLKVCVCSVSPQLLHRAQVRMYPQRVRRGLWDLRRRPLHHV